MTTKAEKAAEAQEAKAEAQETKAAIEVLEAGLDTEYVPEEVIATAPAADLMAAAHDRGYDVRPGGSRQVRLRFLRAQRKAQKEHSA